MPKPFTETTDDRYRGNDPCVIEDCARPQNARGLCQKHWQWARNKGILKQYPILHKDRQVGVCKRGHLRTPDNIRPREKNRVGGCKACLRERSLERRREQKNFIFRGYGSRCACCGESDFSFLCLDHVNGDGNKHRKILGPASTAMYYYVIQNDFPKNIQLLCHNCNMAKSISRINKCPGHRTQRSLRDLVMSPEFSRKVVA